jgi:acyl-CoA reductase-like NAD-dependent aldehyde dehydrogenase
VDLDQGRLDRVSSIIDNEPTSVLQDARLTTDVRAFLASSEVQEPHIGGSRRVVSGAVVHDRDPATGRTIALVRSMTAANVDDVVESARSAGERWRLTPPAERSHRLFELAERMDRDAEALAQLECLDTGKPLREARGDVARAIDGMRFYAGLARQVRGETINVEAGLRISTMRYPVGVVAAIVPWNVPLVLTVCKAAPALAAGNSVVVKPAEVTPLTALWLAEIAVESGIPSGLLNVVLGSGSTVGAALASHPGVAKVTFTGSTETGVQIAQLAAPALKSIALELGGKSPHVIFADADLDAAAVAAARGIFYGQGEICTAGSRVLIERVVFDRVLEKIREHASALVIGDPLDEATEFGSLISEEHLNSVLACVERGVAEHAELVQGGARITTDSLALGAFMQPTILINRDRDTFIEQHEIFGPVMVVSAFDTEAEAIARSNNTRFGLAAGVWTRDSGRVQRMTDAFESGVVWVNTYGRFDAAAPVGGIKCSGNAREWSHLAMDFFSHTKTVWEQI